MTTCGKESAPRLRCEQLGIRYKPRCLGWLFIEVEYAGVHVPARRWKFAPILAVDVRSFPR